MESKIEWHKTSKELPKTGVIVLICHINNSIKENHKKIYADIGYIEIINGFQKWRVNEYIYCIRKFNRWAYFPYPTE